MTKTYQSYKDILIEKLEALVDEQTPTPDTIFAAVYGSNVTEPEGYPVCYVVEKSGAGVIKDTHRNVRIWEFSVVIHYALGDEKEEDVSPKLLDAVDRVVQMFDRDPMLATEEGEAQCSRVEVTPVEVERGNQDVAVIRALLRVRIEDLVQRY